jgi:hypothetical protein
MEHDLHSVTSQTVSGSVTRLQTRLTEPVNWLGPAWAALCGALASGSSDWQGEGWLKLAVLVLLVDVGWGGLWAALGSSDWAATLVRWREWRAGDPVAAIPYTLPGSPGDRISRWAGQLRAWWREVFWVECGVAFSAVLVALLVTLVLATLLGADVLLLSLAALALMQLGLVWEGGRGVISPTWDAFIGVALPWMAGHMLFSGSLPLLSGTVAFAFALAWGMTWRADGRGECALGFGAQLLLFLLLVALRRPLAAGGLVFLFVPQLALRQWLGRGLPVSWYVRHTRPWLMLAMLVAAWAL